MMLYELIIFFIMIYILQDRSYLVPDFDTIMMYP